MTEFALTDIGRARWLADHIKGEFAYVPEFRRKGWLRWSGKAWEVDEGGVQIAGLLMNVIEDQAARALERGDKRMSEFWHGSQSFHVVRNSVELVRSFLTSKPEDFDVDGDLLNTQNGVVCLRSGTLFAHDPEKRMTRIAAVDYKPEAQCQKWLEYLEFIMPDADTREFVQRAAGYSLTPFQNEQVFFVLSGREGTGKSTFVETMRTVFGTYAATCAPETLTTARNGPRSDLASLRGSRMVCTQETRANDELDVSLIKRLTGEEMLTAAFKHQDEIEFYPSWKTWISYNHVPSIPQDSTGLWRRIRVLEIDKQPKKLDPHFRDKLLEESEGILAWAVEGAVKWFAYGLGTPRGVTVNVRRTREQQDTISTFVTDRCMFDSAVTTSTSELYRAYIAHCESVLNRKPAQIALFSEVLSHTKGVERRRTARGSYLRGIKLRQLAPSLHNFEGSEDGEEWLDGLVEQVYGGGDMD